MFQMGMGGMANMPMNMNMGNMGMNMNGMNMNGMNIMNMNDMMNNMNIPGMNIGGNENWLKGYNVNNNNNNGGNNINSQDKKITCIFNTTTGGKKPITILIDYGKTVNELIKIYFARLSQPELMERRQDICLLYNAHRIDFDSTQKVEDFFKYNTSPTILVSDLQNLIGA